MKIYILKILIYSRVSTFEQVLFYMVFTFTKSTLHRIPKNNDKSVGCVTIEHDYSVF